MFCEDYENDREWNQFWLVMAIFTGAECVSDMTLFWLPLYNELKVACVIWLARFNGAKYLYHNHVHPYLTQNAQNIQDALENIDEMIKSDIYSRIRTIATSSKAILLELLLRAMVILAYQVQRHAAQNASSSISCQKG